MTIVERAGLVEGRKDRDSARGIRAGLTAALVTGLVVLGLAGASPAQADIEEMVLRVDGLACPFCSYGLEKKLTRFDGVREIDIQMDAGKAVLSLEPGTVISPEELEQAVSDAGFTLAGLELTATGKLVTRQGQPCLEFGGDDPVLLLLRGDELLRQLLVQGEGTEVRVVGRAIGSESRTMLLAVEVGDYDVLS